MPRGRWREGGCRVRRPRTLGKRPGVTGEADHPGVTGEAGHPGVTGEAGHPGVTGEAEPPWGHEATLGTILQPLLLRSP